MVTLSPPSKAAVDVILQYAPKASAAQPEEMSKALDMFIAAVYATDFMVPFDWMKEVPKASLDPDNLSELKTADAAQLRKLLIAHLRLDRFLEGHLERLLTSGYLDQLLARLKALRSAL
jgi:hypothetical protein